MLSANNSNHSSSSLETKAGVKAHDSATRFLVRTGELIKSLEMMLAAFPDFQNPSLITRVLFNRKVNRARNKFNSIKAVFTALLASGKELYDRLNITDEDFKMKVSHITSLAEDPNFVEIVVNYLAASATIGVILNDIMKIADDFHISFQNTAVLSANRSAKIELMMNEIKDEEAPGQEKIERELREKVLPDELRQKLDALKTRLKAVAVVSDIVASFSDFALAPRKKSAAQLAREAAAELMDIEQQHQAYEEEKNRRIANGSWNDLEDGFIEINYESKNTKVKALRDFSKKYDMDLLFYLLHALRKWKRDEKNSTATLNEVISTLIKYSDKALLENKHTVDAGLKYREEELEELAEYIDQWLNDRVKDDKIQIYILSLKEQAIDRIREAEELSSQDLQLLVNRLKHIQTDDELTFADHTVHHQANDSVPDEQYQQEVGEEVLEDSTKQLLRVLSDLGMNNDTDNHDVDQPESPVKADTAQANVSKLRNTVALHQMPYSAPKQPDHDYSSTNQLK